MRVAIYNYGNLYINGHYTACKNLIKMFEKIGCKVDCFTFISTRFKFFKTEIKKPRFYTKGFRTIIFSHDSKDEIISKLNTYDLVILFKTPNIYGTLNDYKVFIEIYQSLTTKTWFQFHKAQNVRNLGYKNDRYLLDIIAGSDVVSAHDNEFSEVAQICRLIGKETHKLVLHYDFTETDKVFNNEKRRSIAHIGKYAEYKGSKELLKIAPYLLKNKMDIRYIGIGKSSAVYREILSNELINKGVFITRGYYPHNIYGLFSNLMFNFNPLKMKGQTYGDRLEYAQLEGIACGTIPVLSLSQGLNCKYKDTCWYDIPYFSIWYDENNPIRCAEKIIDVANNENLQKKYRGVALEIFKEILDVSNFLKYIEEVMNKPSDKMLLGTLLYKAKWESSKIEEFLRLSKTQLLKQDFNILLEQKIISVDTF